MIVRALFVIRNDRFRKRLLSLLDDPDTLLTAVDTKGDLLAQITGKTADLIVLERSLLTDPSSQLKQLRELPEKPSLVLFYEKEDAEERARLLAAGADAVLYAGLSTRYLREVLKSAVEKHRQRGLPELTQVPIGSAASLADFDLPSPSLQHFMRTVRRVSASDASLLLLGETGVGKEWLARAIHSSSSRSSGPFLAVNCGGWPESLLESELFGHEEGAFTGAVRARRGCFELAHGGTLFLDEIGEIPFHLQVKLLRVLQDHEVQRVGAERSLRVDVRVMAASNRDLKKEVAARNFRGDLFYRLSVVSLQLPPLRERIEDIPQLARIFLEERRARLHREVHHIAPEVLLALQRYAWPGNVRELRNVVERAILLASGPEIGLADLPEELTGIGLIPTGGDPGKEAAWIQQPLRTARKAAAVEFERRYLIALLRQTQGRIGETARLAALTPRSLYEKMKRTGLRKEDFRPRRDTIT